MQIYSYAKEDFGYLVAFREGVIGLYADEAGALCALGADSEALAPYKLAELEITPDFHLHAPLVAWLEVTRRCNLKCSHCFVSAASLNESQPDELTTEQLLQLIDDLKKQNVFSIVFTGGEPFARPDFLEILDHATKHGFVIGVITNGLRLTQKIISRIPRGNIRITISLDNLHFGDADRCIDNQKFRYVQSRFLLLKKAGVACHANATMTRQNLSTLKEVFDWLESEGIGYREIPFSPIGRGASCPELQMTVSEVEEAAKLWAMSMLNERTLQIAKPCLTFDQCYDFTFNLVYMAKACKGARFLAYIAANGDVYPCTMCVGTGNFMLGNVKNTPFRDIWESSAQEFRQISRWDNYTECKKCALSSGEYFCTNRCPAMSLQYHGTPWGCGATPFDKASLAYRTRNLGNLSGMINRAPANNRQCLETA